MVFSLKLLISVLCAVGLWASVFMSRKALRDARGELAEPSVVQQPPARLFFGVPNAFVGVAYYAALVCAVWLGPGPAWAPVLAAAALAAAASAYLAFSLTFVTRMSCRYCWSAHVANWLIASALVVLHKLTLS
ncbi:MAG: hypothetical protein JO277_02540 [Candidatus Eremiobacteraeota bacterium]|nr:hypothetical protein [Candidatus Eremiobacteraeota bacterium]